MKDNRTPLERLYARIDRAIGDDSCWIWQGSIGSHGYGQLTVHGRIHTAHRLMWETVNGPVPPGMHVCHTCDVRWCINPSHLFLGTPTDNQRDCLRKGRNSRGSKRPAAKLREEDIPVIRSLLSQGKRGVEIAEIYGVNASQISAIACGKAWKHA